MSEQAHCGNWCCWYNVHLRQWEVTGRRGEREEVWPTKFCPETGEHLTVVGGQPVVEQRPTAEYVRLLEAAARNLRTRWYAEWVLEVLPASCYQRITHHGPMPCAHEDPPIGCLRALAAEREEKGECDRG